MSWRPWAIATAALGLLLAASIAMRPGPPPSPAPMRFEIQPEKRGEDIAHVLVSPDAAWVAMASARGRGLVRSLATGATRVLPEGAPRAFSADGKSVLIGGGGPLRRFDLNGGGVQTVCTCSTGAGIWADDGTVWLGNNRGPLLRVPASGGQPLPALPLDKDRGETRQRFPAVLPDGKRILYVSRGAGLENSGIYLASLDGSTKPTRVYPSDSPFIYIHPNRLLVSHGGGLAVVDVNLDTGASGDPRMISDAVQTAFPNTFAASRDGRVIVLLASKTHDEMALFDRSGRKVAGLGQSMYDGVPHPEFSPDGKRLVFERPSTPESQADLWIYDLERRSTSRLTFSPEGDVAPAWSASGDRVFFFSRREKDKEGIYEIAANGTGTERQIARTPAHHMHASPDGRSVVFERTSISTGGAIWSLPLPEGGKPQPVLTNTILHPRVSPDSRFLAYSSGETARGEIYIQTFPPGGGKWMVSKNGGAEPKWRADGKELYFSNGSTIMAVPITIRDQAIVAGEPEPLFDLITADRGRHYAVSPDGKLFAAVAVLDGAQDLPVTVLLNWDLGGAQR